MAWSCYVLARDDSAHTYCGMTNNLARRLRQHNGEITGGARATARRGAGWRVAMALHGFATQREALQAEWRWKHPAGRPRSRCAPGLAGRAAGLRAVLAQQGARWTRSAPHAIADTPLTLVCGDAAVLRSAIGGAGGRYPALRAVVGDPLAPH